MKVFDLKETDEIRKHIPSWNPPKDMDFNYGICVDNLTMVYCQDLEDADRLEFFMKEIEWEVVKKYSNKINRLNQIIGALTDEVGQTKYAEILRKL